MTRVVVTGIGLVTPLARSAGETWEKLVRGDRAIAPLSLFDVSAQKTRLAAEVKLPERAATQLAWSRTTQMAHLAVSEAIGRAGVSGVDRMGLVIGGTTGGMFENEAVLAKLHGHPKPRDALVGMLSHPLTATGDLLAQEFPAFSRVRTLCSACSSGANAIIAGIGWLLAGDFDVVVAGGADALCRLTFTGFNALAAIDAEPCRPFDRQRRGLSLGEGAGFVVLERAEHARARGARPIAELAGWSLGAEAHHITNPEPTGTIVAGLVARAIHSAKLSLSDIDYINAHGTGTTLNDTMEAAALSRVFGKEIERVPVSSSKGQIGHTLGAAGGIEAVLAAMSIEHQTILPTIGLEEPDPACQLAHVFHRGRKERVRAAISNSFGFGGTDSVLVFTEPELASERTINRARVVITGTAVLSERGVTTTSNTPHLLGDSREEPQVEADTNWESYLDPVRARRLDGPARLATVVAEHALADAQHSELENTGAIFGSAFGSLDASAAFMHRVFDKGPRLASPADFPNLVPSSPVGHMAIYLGLRGPVFMTADLATSGESAIVQAAQLIAMGDAERIVAGAAEDKSELIGRVLSSLFARTREIADKPHRQGAAAIVLENEDAVRARGGRVLCSLAQVIDWHDETDLRCLSGIEGNPLAKLIRPRNPSRSCVVLPRLKDGSEELIRATPWSEIPQQICAASLGEHDGLGAVAIAAGAALIARGDFDEVLTIGLAKGRGYATVLVRADAGTHRSPPL